MLKPICRSDVPKGGNGSHCPSLSALVQGALRPRNIVFKHYIKRLLGRKINIKVSFMCPWLSEGPLMTQLATDRLEVPIRRESPRVTWGLLRKQVAPSWPG